MGVFGSNKNVLTCVYNSKRNRDIQTLGYLKASDKDLLTIDISKDTLTGTQWIELAERLEKPIQDIIDSNAIEGDITDFDTNSCISILRENTEALNGVIVFTEGKAIQVITPSKVLGLLNVEAAAIKKKYTTQ